MGTFETLTLLGGILSMCIAVAAAANAKKSADSAKEQADAATLQVRYAAEQAGAARGQVEVMRRTMAIDHIGLALRYRRRADDIQLEIAEVRAGLSGGIHDPKRAAHFGEVEAIVRELEDMPPVFSSSTRQTIYAFLSALGRGKVELYMGAEEPAASAALRTLHQQMIAAMQAEIEEAIDRIDRDGK